MIQSLSKLSLIAFASVALLSGCATTGGMCAKKQSCATPCATKKADAGCCSVSGACKPGCTKPCCAKKKS